MHDLLIVGIMAVALIVGAVIGAVWEDLSSRKQFKRVMRAVDEILSGKK